MDDTLVSKIRQFLTSNKLINGCGVTIISTASLNGLGITWSCLLAITFCAVYFVNLKLSEGQIDQRNSVENLHNQTNAESKKARILAKKKEKYEMKKSKVMVDEDADGVDETNLRLQQQICDENFYGEIDYQAAAAYHGVFAVSNSASNKISHRKIPSLKSPQPLLSAVHSRVSQREYNRMSSTLEQTKNYPLSPRSVFDTVQNRSVMSPLNRSWTVKEANLFRNQSFEAQKAVSPPGGRFFSRIRNDFPQDNKNYLNSPVSTIARTDNRVENQMKLGKLDDSCSKESVVKVLQEKTANKRKRATCEALDTTVPFYDKLKKKRRVQDDTFEETFTEFKNGEVKKNDENDLRKVETSIIQTATNKSLNEEDESLDIKEKKREVKNKYGMTDNEVESITDDENMEIDKKQAKRKVKERDENGKKKKSREDKSEHNKKKDAKQTPKSKNSTKKATPVRSVETQTPTKFYENVDTKNSPRPSRLKTPYKKVFTSGFPSNLKPATAEKKQRMPIEGSDFGQHENIQTEVKKPGTDVTNVEKAITSAAASEPETQPTLSNEMLNTIATVLASSTVTSSQTFQLPTLLPAITSNSQQLKGDAVKSPPEQSFNSLTTTAVKPIIGTNSAAVNEQPITKLNIPSTKSDDKSQTISFGLQHASPIITATTTPATATVTSSTTFGMLQPSNLSFGGFSFSTQSSSGATSTAPGFTFGQSVNAKTDQLLPISSKQYAPSQPTQAVISENGGFKFGTSVGSGQMLISASISQGISASSTETSKTTGFSFGVTSTKEQSSFGNTKQASSAAENSSKSNANANLGGFNFGANVTSSSQPVSSNTFGGFSFGASTLSQPTVSASTISTTIANSIPATALGGGFKFDAAKSTAPSFGSFSFGSTLSSQASKNNSTVAGSSTGNAIFGANSQAKTMTTPLFQAPSSKPQQIFGTPTTSVAINLFGTPSTSVTNSTQPLFGSVQTNPSAQLFGTTPSTKAPSLFGASTQSTNSTGSVFGTSTLDTKGSIFGATSLNNNANGPLFGAVSQPSSSSTPMFGVATQISNASSLFGASSQTAGQQSGTLFGAKPASTATQLFGTATPANTFSFSGNQNTTVFGNVANKTSSGTGGFSFGSNSQTSSTNNNSFGQFGGQTASNPFASNSAFGQPPATTTASGFSFGSAPAPAFGQASNNPPSFGASPATFAPNGGQTQAGGFNFAAAAAQKPTTFSFGGAAGASTGGFTSRPGTPTPFNNAQAPAADVFATPQQQGVGFAMGSGVSSRPTVKGRRRTRR